MKVQYEHEIISSFLLFLDHQLCHRGKAYTNYSSSFYPISGPYQDYYTYSSPFKQFVSDSSVGIIQGEKIRKPTVMTGVYLDGHYLTPGVSGLVSIDNNMGQIHFSEDYPDSLGVLPSGNYAVKDFNIYLTNEPENVLLFETQFKLNPRVEQNPTGLASNARTYPAIYVKNQTSVNERIGIGGDDGKQIYDTEMYVRAIVLSDSAFSLDACCGLMKDFKKKKIPKISAEDQPFTPLGYTGGSPFNYTGLVHNQTSGGWHEDNSVMIDDVNVSKRSQNRADFNKLNTEIFVGFVDFTLKNIRDI